jgi:ribosomal protein S18 acetylase RimI-like enzyme
VVAQRIRVRLCEERDLEHFGPFGSPQHLVYCRDEFARGREALAILVAVDSDDEPVGKVHLDFEARSKEGAAVLVAAAVTPSFRGRGIGTELMREAEAYVGGRGIRAIELGVEDSNPGARRPYERLGYEVFATDNFVYLGAPIPNPGVWMRKELAT